jgi:hypothetical protein
MLCQHRTSSLSYHQTTTSSALACSSLVYILYTYCPNMIQLITQIQHTWDVPESIVHYCLEHFTCWICYKSQLCKYISNICTLQMYWYVPSFWSSYRLLMISGETNYNTKVKFANTMASLREQMRSSTVGIGWPSRYRLLRCISLLKHHLYFTVKTLFTFHRYKIVCISPLKHSVCLYFTFKTLFACISPLKHCSYFTAKTVKPRE